MVTTSTLHFFKISKKSTHFLSKVEKLNCLKLQTESVNINNQGQDASFTWQGLGITVLDSCWLILNFSIIDNNFLNGVHREIQIQKYLQDFLWA